MSHEGIRIVTEEQARREIANEVHVPADSITPLKVRIMKSEGTGISIGWKDGHHSSWNFSWLRNACPCATCNEERSHNGRPLGDPKPKPGGPLVLYEAPPRPLEVNPVGKYAIRFKWNDGHESGIYSWDYLRRVCQCGHCQTARAQSTTF